MSAALPPLVGYLRVSTKRQVEEGLGLDVQERLIRDWAKTNKRRISGWHSDEGVSGTLLERDGWADVDADLIAKRAGGVVVAKLDRLARDILVQETLMQAVWKAGAEVYSCAPDENNLRDDPDDPTRKLVRRMLGLINDYERDMIVLRMRRGRRLKGNRGGFAFGSPAFGQRSVNKQLVNDPTEQATLRRMRELHRAAQSTRHIARTLNSEGRATKRGKEWTSASVSDALRREVTGKHRGKAATAPH